MLHGIFDSHAHYDDARFAGDVFDLLDGFKAFGVTGVISCGVNAETTRFAQALAKRYDFVYAAAGFHPLNLADVPDDPGAALEALLEDPKTVAVGEIGLDYHYEKESRGAQLALFERQLQLANAHGLPVIVHDREAHADTLALLRQYRPRGVVHCFSGAPELAREVLELGMYIGLGGAVTFRNAKKPAAVAAMVPDDRLLLETDAPYMAPEPYRGQRCDSRMIAATAERIAALRGTNAQALLTQTAQNARTLFGL